jgi:DNA polymerase III subunit delta'
MIWKRMRGHDAQVQMFRRSLGRGRLSHAYLFVGPGGIGKQLFATNLAQCLLCRQTSDVEVDACGECSGCKQMQAGTHPDFFRLGRPEGKSELPIELFVGSRERRGQGGLCHELSLRPMAGGRRIAVIDDADLMNEASANALLKTLEEPPADSLLILISENSDGILPTIRSRCQMVRFAPLSSSDLSELLVELEMVPSPREADELASLSEGSLTVAGQLLDPGLRELRDAVYDSLAEERFDSLAASSRTLAGLEKLGGDTAAQRENGRWVVKFCIEFYRRAVLRLSRPDASDSIPQLEKFVRRFTPGSADDLELIMSLFDRAMLADGQLQQRMSAPLCLEGLFDELGRIGRAAGVR